MGIEFESVPPELRGKVRSIVELAAYYRISTKTMRKRIRESGVFLRMKKRKKNYTVMEVKNIIDELGEYEP